MAPRLACEAFATLTDVLSAPCGCSFTEAEDGALLTELVDEATDMLYVLSGGRVTGRCTRKVWPIKTGECSDYEYQSWVSRDSVDSIPLPGPDTAVTQVKIDGSVVSPSDYFLLDGYKLVRRSGDWPVSNDITKADTQQGTFTITVQFGWDIREIARRAAIELTCLLYSSPARLSRLRGVVSANIQGVSVQMDPEEVAEMGLPELNRFMDFHAPRGVAVLGVWSPELSHGWRLASVS
jgi:hypothetical protein